MPSGHTTKQTLTPYRAGLLRALPVRYGTLNHNDRKQLNQMCRFGWAQSVAGDFVLTDAGLDALAKFEVAA